VNKKKRKEKSSRSNIPRPPYLKQVCKKSENIDETLTNFFDAKLKINEGIEVNLTLEEVKMVSHAHPKILLYRLHEFQPRIMVMG